MLWILIITSVPDDKELGKDFILRSSFLHVHVLAMSFNYYELLLSKHGEGNGRVCYGRGGKVLQALSRSCKDRSLPGRGEGKPHHVQVGHIWRKRGQRRGRDRIA